MGVRGFTSFVDSRSRELLVTHKLHNGKIIIDGNNFYHFLYHYLRINQYYGGDYDLYYQKVCDVFDMFAKCSIEPYVVLDGGYEPDGRKVKTVLRHVVNRLNVIKEASKGVHGLVCPLLVDEVFKKVLIDKHIPFVVCDFDADVQIAKLANDFECPVISNDSDFCIFNLKAGLIILDYINFSINYQKNTFGEDLYYLSVELYNLNSFKNVFPKFNTSLLPVLSFLIGNDFIDSSEFAQFFSAIYRSPTKQLPKSNGKIIAVIRWLTDFMTCQQATTAILNQVSEDRRQDINQMIDVSMRFYEMQDETFCLKDYFTGDRDASLIQLTETLYRGHSLPQWYYKGHRSGTQYPSLINVPCLHMILLQPQFENLRETSAYATSSEVRQAIYSIIMQDKTLKAIPSIIEYSRDKCGNLKKIIVEPSSMVEFLPSLSEIPSYPTNVLRQLFLDILKIPKSLLGLFSHELQLLACTIVYWITHSQPNVSVEHYYALLICLIRVQASTRLKEITSEKENVGVANNNETCNQKDVGIKNMESEPILTSMKDGDEENSVISVKKACSKSTKSDMTNFITMTNKFTTITDITTKKPVDCSIAHGTSQFQACLINLINLNRILRIPLTEPYIHCIFNGTFIYNLVKDLRKRQKPEMYMDSVSGSKSSLHEVFDTINITLRTYIDDSYFSKESKWKKRKGGRKKKKKKSFTKVTESSSEEIDEPVIKEEMQGLNDLDNKFSCLFIK